MIALDVIRKMAKAIFLAWGLSIAIFKVILFNLIVEQAILGSTSRLARRINDLVLAIAADRRKYPARIEANRFFACLKDEKEMQNADAHISATDS